MHIIYKITYLPHLETAYSKYYVGSKYNYKEGYLGSVSSSKIFEYTDGKSLRDWWKEKTKNSPESFVLDILMSFDEISTSELIDKERECQLSLGVDSEEYFNQCFANKGFFSSEKSEETKKKQSDATRLYWSSEEGKRKRERMSDRNRRIKSAQMKERWKNPTDKMIAGNKISGSKIRKQIEFYGYWFDGWADFIAKTGISRHKYMTYYASGRDPGFKTGWQNVDIDKVLEKLKNEDSTNN